MRAELMAPAPGASPLRPLRVLIEDPLLANVGPMAPGPFQVTVCSGPDEERETCPLVMEGTCPLGPFDVVVGALGGLWAHSVRTAWSESSTPYVEAAPTAPGEPAARVEHHIGTALQRLANLAARPDTAVDVPGPWPLPHAAPMRA